MITEITIEQGKKKRKKFCNREIIITGSAINFYR